MVESVQYFKVDGIAGDYFACERYGTMSVNSCARNYKEAPRMAKLGRFEACIGCPAGLVHAGGPVPTAAAAEKAGANEPALYCVRCRKSGRDIDSNLVGRMRLVRGHTICVSCFNREREVLLGRNAKGAKPKKWRGLFYARVGVVMDGVMQVEQLSKPVHDTFEAVLTVMRRPGDKRPQFLGWASRSAILPDDGKGEDGDG